MIHRIEIVNDHMIEIFHAFQDDCDPVQTNVNIFVACFTTSYARLELYNALDILQQSPVFRYRFHHLHSETRRIANTDW